MNLARQKTCKVLMQVHQKFVIHLAEPIWIRNRLEALSYFSDLFSHRGLRQVKVVLQANIP